MARRVVVRFFVALAVCMLAARGMQLDSIAAGRRLATLPLGTPAATLDSASAAGARDSASHTSFTYWFAVVVILLALLLGAIEGPTALILFIWPDRSEEPPFASLVPRNGPE
ncbi:MAG TPA: hypothetical protein VNW46_06180 [Gemmatimonadaceae bacterium]|jgi:hypothetical protein|nr:hypothetical protein [Gemmatimonadaceae bacterium]